MENGVLCGITHEKGKLTTEWPVWAVLGYFGSKGAKRSKKGSFGRFGPDLGDPGEEPRISPNSVKKGVSDPEFWEFPTLGSVGPGLFSVGLT